MRRLLVALALAACTPTQTGSGPNTVSLTVLGTPTLIAYRDGTADWATPAKDAYDAYQLQVTDDYEIVVVCSDAYGFTSKQLARTFADGAQGYVYCDDHGDPTASIEMTGEMLQPGTVSMYDFVSSTSAPWNFSLQVEPGTYDLGATSADGKLAIVRDVDAGSGGTLAASPLDVDKTGTPLVPTALTVTGRDPGDSMTNEVDVYTQNSVISGPVNPEATAQVPPTALLQASDQLDLYIEVSTATTARTADEWFTPSATAFALMPALDGVAFDETSALRAMWTALPQHDTVSLDVTATAGQVFMHQQRSASQSWLDKMGVTDLALDEAMPPRFQAAWTIDLSQPHVRSLTASNGSTGIEYTTTLLDPVGGAAAEIAPRARAHAIGASRRILP